MRRKAGVLIPIERSILSTAVQLRGQGVHEFHGFQIAKAMKDREEARHLTGYGTLYRALERLEQQGFLRSHWEDPLPADQNRPRRRLYQLTGAEAKLPSNVLADAAPTILVWGTLPS
jgi:PadR family transcriptional regulator PadR